MMISLTSIAIDGPAALLLEFSDGSTGVWHAKSVIARDTILTRPLSDPAYFARAFIEGEALAWPNGLEFSAFGLHQKLDAAGTLVRKAA